MPLTFTIDSPCTGDTVGLSVTVTGSAVVTTIVPAEALVVSLVRLTLSNATNSSSTGCTPDATTGNWTATLTATAGSGYTLRAEYYADASGYANGDAPDAITTETDITVQNVSATQITISTITNPSGNQVQVTGTTGASSGITSVIVTSGMPGEQTPPPPIPGGLAPMAAAGPCRCKKSGVIGTKLVTVSGNSFTATLRARNGRIPVRVIGVNSSGDLVAVITRNTVK